MASGEAAILWDNDGVLVDTEPVYRDVSRAVMRELGYALSDEQFCELSLRQGRSAFEVAREQGCPDALIEEAIVRRDRLYAEHLAREGAPIIEGVHEVLEALAGRARMGIVTSSQREPFEHAHRGHGLLEHFEFVLTREEYAKSKPDPEPYLTALSRHGLDPARATVVEDTLRGLASARAAGLPCVVIPHALTSKDHFEGALAVLGSIRELPALLEREGRID